VQKKKREERFTIFVGFSKYLLELGKGGGKKQGWRKSWEEWKDRGVNK
jgi:hypothetical protein